GAGQPAQPPACRRRFAGHSDQRSVVSLTLWSDDPSLEGTGRTPAGGLMRLTRTRDRTASDLHAFNARVDEVVHAHPVVVDNRYTRWFARGDATRDQVRH